jgi:hypothetical protein
MLDAFRYQRWFDPTVQKVGAVTLRLKLSGGFCGQSLLRRSHNDTETCGIVHCHLGQLLSIDLNLGQQQTMDELAVTETMHARSRVDANDPKSSEVPSFSATVTVRKATCTYEIFFGCSV